MSEIALSDYASLAPAELEGLRATVRQHQGLDDLFAWGRAQSPPVHPADVIKQDEFTHDVLVPFPGSHWLVYGTT